MSVVDLYKQLFGRKGIADGSVIDMAEHGRVGGLSTGQPFKIVSLIDGLEPTEGNNPSLALTYTGDNLTKITKTISGTDYEKTLSYTGSTLDSVSGWSEV